MSHYVPRLSARDGDPNCSLCKAQFHRAWSSLPEINAHADDGCPYCANMREGLLYLEPNLVGRFGEGASLRFRSDYQVIVYCSKDEMELQYRWFMVGEPQPYEPAADTDSEGTFETVKGWVRECLDNHKLCGKGELAALPTRILDLGDEDGEKGQEMEKIRLIEPSSDQTGRYISLSHSWGGESPLTTTALTLNQHKAGIPLDSLPATFRDACHIARRLGIRYLWIDSLCILQDSPSDWEVEASRMASIYRNSWLTVFATASASPSSGIIRRRNAVWIAADDPEDAEMLDVLFPEAAKLRRNLRLSLRFASTHPDFGPYADPNRQKEDLPLLTRAWAYQERLLAPRVLHFGPTEVFWECMQNLDCDCGGIKQRTDHMGSYMNRDTTAELPPKVSHYAALHVGAAAAHQKNKSKTSGEKRTRKLLARWQEMVEEYTRRTLSFSADRLPAFSGVAAEMVDALGMAYCAGQWKETLPQALLFERRNATALARLAIDDPRPAPSWSWASPDDPVQFLVPLVGPEQWENPVVHAKVLEVVCVPSGRDERGQVDRVQSSLVISAELVKASLCFSNYHYFVPDVPWTDIKEAIAAGTKGPTKDELGPATFMVRVGKQQPLWLVLDVRLCGEDGKWLWKGEDEVYCARIMQVGKPVYWLVLRRIAIKDGDPAYERIGVVGDHEAVWPREETRTSIKLV